MALTESDAVLLLEELEARLVQSPSACLDVSASASIAELGAAYVAFAARLHPSEFALVNRGLRDRADRALAALRPVYWRAVLERTEQAWDEPDADDDGGLEARCA